MSTTPTPVKPMETPAVKTTEKKPKEIKLSNKDEAENTTRSISLNTNFMLLGDKKDFQNILKVAGERVLLIEFFANWCGPCRLLGDKVEELANSYNGKILVVKVDIDDFEEIALEYDVSAMPTFMIMKNQKKLEQFSSSKWDVLEQNLEKYVGKLDTAQEGETVATSGTKPNSTTASRTASIAK